MTMTYNDVVCKSTKKRVRQYFKKQLRHDLHDPNFVAAESTIACGVCNVSITLFNTGLAADGSVDPHYKLILSSDPANPTPPDTYAIIANPLAVPQWFPNDAFSKWISPTANQTCCPAGAGNADGDYTYRTTFDLTGLDPLTASISGKWATDNAGLNILINGHPTGNVTGPTDYGFLTPFSILPDPDFLLRASIRWTL